MNDTLGWIYVKKGVPLKATWHLELAAEGLKKNPQVYFHLAKAHEDLGDTERSAAALRRALSLSTDFQGVEEARALLAKLENP